MEYTIQAERLTADEYIAFLKTTDLGSQYPKERFRQRIETLVSTVPISLAARDETGTLIGAVFAITDFAYWMFVTDLGVARDWEKKGIGTALLRQAHESAGGEKDIAVYLVANENAIPFYEKFGMWKTKEVMEYSHIDWTPFTVE